LIDGVPYNAWDKGGFPQHPSLDFFVIQNIKRLEVIRGPGSALYGENAYWASSTSSRSPARTCKGGQVEAFGGSRETGSLGTYYGRRFSDASLFVSGKFHPQPVADGVLGRHQRLQRQGLRYFREGIESRAAGLLLPSRRFGGWL
jgi:outer membrane receptor protein involved in Fe transport